MSIYSEFRSLNKSHQAGIILFLLLFLLNGIYGQFLVLFKYKEIRRDLPTYYVAAKICQPQNNLYDHSLFQQTWKEEQIPEKILLYMYPPFFASMLRPFSQLSFSSFEVLWLLFDYLMLLVIWIMIIKLLLKYYKASPLIFALPLLLFMIYSPVERNIICGQTNLLITALLLAMFLSMKRGNYGWAGVWLAVPIIVKLSPVIFVLYFAIKRKWGAIASCLITLLLLFLISLPICGMNNWGNFIGKLVTSLRAPADMMQLGNAPTDPVAEYSLLRFLEMLFYGVQITDYTSIAQIIHKIISVFILVFTFYRIANDKEHGISLLIKFQLLVCVMLIISPISHHTHFVFLLPGFAFLLYRMLKADFRLSDVLLLSVSFLLIAQSDILPRIPMGEHRILYLLKPVKFYGLIMLYAYLLMLINRGEITDKAIETNGRLSVA